MRIVILMEGGTVHTVLADEECRVVIVDADCEGFDAEELTTFDGKEYLLSEPFVEIEPEMIDTYMEPLS